MPRVRYYWRKGLVVLPTGLRIELSTAASLRRFFSLLGPCFCLRMHGSFTSSLDSSGHLWYLVLRSHFSSNGNMQVHRERVVSLIGAVGRRLVGETVRRERRWTSVGATPTRELVRSTR